jgi:hypothetical protein
VYSNSDVHQRHFAVRICSGLRSFLMKCFINSLGSWMLLTLISKILFHMDARQLVAHLHGNGSKDIS